MSTRPLTQRCQVISRSVLLINSQKKQETHLEFSVFSSFLISELEATEACRWLRATGFPQYAQMYEGKKIVFLGRVSRWLPSSSCVYTTAPLTTFVVALIY